ncbi:hypothetical protein D3C81_1669140 [compost metagenome]
MSSPLDVLMALLAESVHHYLGHLRVVKQVARELRQRFSRPLDNEHLMQMYNLGSVRNPEKPNRRPLNAEIL